VNTDATSTLAPHIDQFVETLEQLVLEEQGSLDAVSEQLSHVRNEAQFLQADQVCDALDQVAAVLDELHDDEEFDPAALLPLVFRVRDAAAELTTAREARELTPRSSSFLEVDLQDEIAAVMKISEESERALNSRVQAGQTPYLLVLRVGPDRLDEIEEFLEAKYQILSYRRQDTTARIAAVVVEVVAPELERVVGDQFGDRSIIKEASVRPLTADSLTVERGITDSWYAGLSPISVEVDPAVMERMWLLMDVLSPTDTRRVEPALWRELRQSIASAFTVELRDVLTDMQASLEEMAIAAGKKIHLMVSGRGAAIGVEIAEPLRRVLFELISNSIVHGIESPTDRQAENKPEVGAISCYIQKDGSALSVRITDDGRGFETAGGHPPKSGGLQRARTIVRDRLGGMLRIRSGPSGVTAIVELATLQGIYRGLVAVRDKTRLVVPSALVVWAGDLPDSRIVVDTTGSHFLRYQRQLIPLVEPELRQPAAEPVDGEPEDSEVALRDSADSGTADLDVGQTADGTTNDSPIDAPAAVVIRVAGQTVALAVDAVQHETVVSTSPGGWLRLSMDGEEWGVGIALQNLPLGT